MQRTKNLQINSKTYWNHIYTTPAREREYWEKTQRFPFFLAHVKDGDKVIDLGCGVGIPCRLVQENRKNCETWGVDISSEVILKNQHDAPSTTWRQGHVGNLGFLPSDYFDVAFCGEVIEHLDDPSLAFTDAYRVLKPGGVFIVTTPLEDHIRSAEHVWEFTKDDVTKLFNDAGFTDVHFQDLPDTEYMIVIFGVGKK